MWCNKMRCRWRRSSSQEFGPRRGLRVAEKWQTSGQAWRGRQRESRTRRGNREEETTMDLLGIVTCDGGYLPDEGSRNDGGKLSLPHAAEARSWGLLPSALQCVRSGLGAWWSTETTGRLPLRLNSHTCPHTIGHTRQADQIIPTRTEEGGKRSEELRGVQ